MAILASAAQAATRRLPRFVSAKSHRTTDYILGGAMIAGGAALWRNNRRASLASLLCGGSLIGLNLATKYSLKNKGFIALAHHREAERGLAVLLGALPEILRLEKGASRYFSAHAIALTILDNLTFFHPGEARSAANSIP